VGFEAVLVIQFQAMWHSELAADIAVKLKSNVKDGLLQNEARSRLRVYGNNILPKGRKSTWLTFLLRQLRSPLVYILIIGAVLTAWLHEWVDMSVILLAVIVNIAVGFWQEYKSNNILESLQKIIRTHAVVRREGEVREIDSSDIVPGDVILLSAGKTVVADARLILAEHLQIDEALLTGESSPVGKSTEIIEESNPAIGDRYNMVHMGTIVASGSGEALVVGTGAQTEIGKIALLTADTEDEPTPLQLRMGKLGTVLAWIIGVATLVIFAVGILEGLRFDEIFTTAIAVAVAAIPEGLPAAISIILAVSAQRILKRKGVVKRLVAAEALGSASVVCTDKTGTLTEGKMRIKELLLEGDSESALHALALANEGFIESTEGDLLVRGETTDQAKLQYFIDEGGNYDNLKDTYPRVSLLSFNPANQYIASLHLTPSHRDYLVFATGSPESILERSTAVGTSSSHTPISHEKRIALTEQYQKYAAEGFRMIALAERILPREYGSGESDLNNKTVREDLVNQLVFIGFAAIRDPIRSDVRASIQTAREAGIRVIMLTGDHLLTARTIGSDLGFDSSDSAVLEGKAVDDMSDMDLAKVLEQIDIYARVNPEHKIRIVTALQSAGEVVAMTGDGVNDAPALKSADVGVALDSGTDVAKEASDLILLNNSFTIIISAIQQGRIAFDNIRKVTVFLLIQSFTELILILSALILRVPLPLTAVMILYTNLIEDSFPNIALSFEPGEKDVMKRQPMKKDSRILDTESRFIVFAIGIFADIILVGLFLFLYFFHLDVLGIDFIRTVIFVSLGIDSFFYIYSIKSLRMPIWRYNPFSNHYLSIATILGVGALLAAVYIPALNPILGTVPLTLPFWLLIIGLSIVKMAMVEVAKWWFGYRKNPSTDHITHATTPVIQ
jgi:P-type Ca2+ transporter type 2C